MRPSSSSSSSSHPLRRALSIPGRRTHRATVYLCQSNQSQRRHRSRKIGRGEERQRKPEEVGAQQKQLVLHLQEDENVIDANLDTGSEFIVGLVSFMGQFSYFMKLNLTPPMWFNFVDAI